MNALLLVLNFMLHRPGSVSPLVFYFARRQRRLLGGFGVFGLIRAHRDTYGYEVFAGWPWAPMLDCNPDWYSLTSAEARLLYDAILSCVTGTCGYDNKLALRRKALGGAA
jgi:hypothetical protein